MSNFELQHKLVDGNFYSDVLNHFDPLMSNLTRTSSKRTQSKRWGSFFLRPTLERVLNFEWIKSECRELFFPPSMDVVSLSNLTSWGSFSFALSIEMLIDTHKSPLATFREESAIWIEYKPSCQSIKLFEWLAALITKHVLYISSEIYI